MFRKTWKRVMIILKEEADEANEYVSERRRLYPYLSTYEIWERVNEIGNDRSKSSVRKVLGKLHVDGKVAMEKRNYVERGTYNRKIPCGEAHYWRLTADGEDLANRIS